MTRTRRIRTALAAAAIAIGVAAPALATPTVEASTPTAALSAVRYGRVDCPAGKLATLTARTNGASTMVAIGSSWELIARGVPTGTVTVNRNSSGPWWNENNHWETNEYYTGFQWFDYTLTARVAISTVYGWCRVPW